VLLSRVMVLLLGIAAYGLSRLSDEFLAVALYAYTIYGAAITPSLLAAFFWRRATAPAAVASILTGTLVTILWNVLHLDTRVPALFAWNTIVDAVLPAAISSVAILVVVSLLTKSPDPEKIRAFA